MAYFRQPINLLTWRHGWRSRISTAIIQHISDRSPICTLSKILERIFLSKIIWFIEQSPNDNRLQSAYRRGYSTETALVGLRLLNDVYCSADYWFKSLLLLLDLSAASSITSTSHSTTSTRAHVRYYEQRPTVSAIIRHQSISVR